MTKLRQEFINHLTLHGSSTKHVSPHILRHCFATHLQEAGVPLKVMDMRQFGRPPNTPTKALNVLIQLGAH